MAPTQATAQAPDQGADLIAAPLIVLGGGEHARVVIEAARTRPDRWVVQGYVGPDEAGGPDDLAWLGEDNTLAARLADVAPGDRPWLVLGFGGGEGPGTLASRVAATDRFGGETRWATIVHATAWVAPSATVEAGAVILASAVVNTGAHVGSHAIVNSAAVVEHDVVIGRGVHVAPGAVIGGGTHIGEGALIGLGARVRDHIEIGAGAIVGMGAVVVGSIAPGARVVGVPARSHDPHRTEPAT